VNYAQIISLLTSKKLLTTSKHILLLRNSKSVYFIFLTIFHFIKSNIKLCFCGSDEDIGRFIERCDLTYVGLKRFGGDFSAD
jgi:hypothetical protein